MFEVTITDVVIENLAAPVPEMTTGAGLEVVNTKLEDPVFFKIKDLENLFPFGTVPKSVKSIVDGVVSPFVITVLLPLTSNACAKLFV